MISDKNKHIEDFLDYYCGLEQSPEYGVMIDGSWGSGKTWFIRKYHDKLQLEKNKAIYISLYGIGSTKEIDEAIFQALHPVLAHKATRLGARIIKGSIKAVLKIDMDGDGKDDGTATVNIPDVNLPDYLNNVDKHIFIFDDLERNELNPDKLLGYINHFVEHEGMKCILIANENELQSKKSERQKPYQEIKDKVIGKRFGFVSDFDSAIADFISKEICNTSHSYLSSQKNKIKSIYQIAGHNNFRHLKQAIHDFERIYSHLFANKNHKSEVIEHFLTSHLFLSLETRSGNIKSSEIIGIESNGTTRYMARHLKKEDQRTNDEIRIDETLEKYKGIPMAEVFPSELFWQEFFDKGIINEENATEAISNSRYFKAENTPSWEILWHLPKMSDQEFEIVSQDVFENYTKKTYDDVRIILHVFGLKLHLSEVGLIHNSPAEILAEAKNYINHLSDTKTIPEVIGKISNGSYILEYYSNDKAEFKELLECIAELQEKNKNRYLEDKAASLLDTISTDFELFCDKITITNSKNNEYYDTPILKFMKISDFLSAISKIDNKKICLLIDSIDMRYRHEKFNNVLSSEVQWLKEISCKLEDESKIRSGKLSGHFYHRLSQEFIKAAHKLESNSGTPRLTNELTFSDPQ